jgi:hypothetical protein
MKEFLGLALAGLLVVSPSSAEENLKANESDSIAVYLTNVLNVSRIDEPICIDIVSIQQKFPDLNPQVCVVRDGNDEIPSQVDDTDRDGRPDLLTFVVNFLPKEKKTIFLTSRSTGSFRKESKKRTQAELSMKVDYELLDGKYTKGRFANIDSVRVPSTHVDHDALFRYEGPGWESEKVAYRLYLDARNRTDIFGKKVPDMVMHIVGVHDLIADNNESYQSPMSWGMDIFKVGTSLGIGSIAMQRENDVVTVSKTESVFCVIAANGPVRSDVQVTHYGWKVGKKGYTLASSYSITAGSRLTKYETTVRPSPENLCTGIARHEQTTLIESSKETTGTWRYLGLYGKQSRAGDNLGIAVFYRASDILQRSDDDVSHIIVLRPHDGRLVYYFAAAWEQEPNGIKTIDEFRSYLDFTILTLDSPIQVNF